MAAQASKGGWVEGLEAEMPVRAGAGMALAIRFDTVVRRLGGDWEDPDAVRKLRVAIRRASAAMEAFGPYLPRKRAKRLRRRMNRIRRRAGRVRDCDVHLNIVEARGGVPGQAAVRIRDSISTLRAKRRRRLEKAVAKGSEAIERDAGSVLERLGRNEGGESDGTSVGDMANAALADGIAEIGAVIGGGALRDRLHEIRIACRRLRYLLELFGETIGLDDREALHGRLVRVQDELGEAGDTRMFVRRLEQVTRCARREGAEEMVSTLEGLIELWRGLDEEASRRGSAYLEERGLTDLEEIRERLREVSEKAGTSG